MVTDLAVASVSHPSSYRNFRSPTEPTGREFRDLQIAETDALPHLREVRDLCVVRAHAKENKNKNTMMVPTPNNKTEKEKKTIPKRARHNDSNREWRAQAVKHSSRKFWLISVYTGIRCTFTIHAPTGQFEEGYISLSISVTVELTRHLYFEQGCLRY